MPRGRADGDGGHPVVGADDSVRPANKTYPIIPRADRVVGPYLTQKEHTMTARKGFSLVELLVVLLVLTGLIAALVPVYFKQINDARGRALIIEARTVYIAGLSIAVEYVSIGYDPEEVEAGLNFNWDTPAYPARTLVADKLKQLLAPDITLTYDVPTSGGPGRATFLLGEDGAVASLRYQCVRAKNLYTVVIEDGKSYMSYERVRN